MRSEDASPGRGFWAALSAILLVSSAVTSCLAPCGFWTNYVFDVPFWHHGDPGGFYLGAAVHFFGPDRSSVGHPGLPLQLFLVASDPQLIPPLWHVHGIYPQLIPPSTPLQRAFEELFTFPSARSGAGPRRVGVVLWLTPDGASIQQAGK